MKRQPLQHSPVLDDPDLAARYAREQRRVFRWMHPAVLESLRDCGFRGGRLLDAGCGPGFHTIGLKKAYPETEIVGVDLSRTMLDLAREEYAASGAGPGLTFHEADVLDLPFSDGSFDAAVSIFVFHLVPDPLRLCNELARVLKPGGKVLIIDLRRNIMLSLLEKEMRSAFTLDEAWSIIVSSRLAPLKRKQTPIWWEARG